MKNIVKYLVGKKECIGNVPFGALILNARIIHLDDFRDALIYMPKRIKYFDGGEYGTDVGCGCLSFARQHDEVWIRSADDYLNGTIKKYEPRKKKKYEI